MHGSAIVVHSLALEVATMVSGASFARCSRVSAALIVERAESVRLLHILAKSFLARCGFNPEGNVDRRPSKSSLEAAF
eukprot:10542427-Alexandrium_andersonii.AAC.1